MIMFCVKTVWEPFHLLSRLNHFFFNHLLQHQTFDKVSVSGITFIIWVLQINRKHSRKSLGPTVGIYLLLLTKCTEIIGFEWVRESWTSLLKSSEVKSRPFFSYNSQTPTLKDSSFQKHQIQKHLFCLWNWQVSHNKYCSYCSS